MKNSKVIKTDFGNSNYYNLNEDYKNNFYDNKDLKIKFINETEDKNQNNQEQNLIDNDNINNNNKNNNLKNLLLYL